MTNASLKSLKFIGNDDRGTAYLHSIRDTQKMSREEEGEVAERIQQGDMRAVNIMVNANLKFVVSVCRQYKNRGLPFGDLINEGNLGLIRAAQRFDAKMGCRFISYAVWWIRQGIMVALSEQTRFLTVAPSRIQTMHKVTKAGNILEQKLGRSPVVEEIAAESGISAEKITDCMQLAAKSVSMNAPGQNGGASLEESLQDGNSAPTDGQAMGFLLRQKLERLLETLDERKAMVLRLHYGIGSDYPMPLADIASRMNLTRERVRQIKAGALSMLRRPSKMKLAAGFPA
ncbi:MAG: RNA polymerase sigma factor RpoD/SigA [Fibrobacterota bacterium]|nr:RNA polymerase sigma factor RpoD/SigA [Fibrobacterota bacterium]